jgi:lysophospholipase L1-like esterase
MVALSRRASNHLVVVSLGLGGLGIAAIALGLSADALGLGDGSVFGPRQLSMIVRGMLAVIFGLFLCMCGLTERHPVLRPFVRATRPLAVLLLVCTTLETVVLAGGILRAYASGSTNARPNFIRDDQLGFRFRGGSRGHDALGFRNPETMDTPTIVAIGDSMTWGVNASTDATWPSVLGAAAHVSVYNMGVPGYGPVQYQLLTQQSQRFSPTILVIALYWGNDLVDAYRSANGRGEHATGQKPQSLSVPYQRRFSTLRSAVANSALVTGIGIIGYQLRATGSSRPTAFMYQKRISCLDLQIEEVAEGLRITKTTLGAIATETGASGTQLLVVAIPTKESAYAHVMPTAAVNHRAVVAMEAKVAEEVGAFCRASDIAYVDTLPPLRQAVAAGEPVYPIMTSDGHPAAHGYAIIAGVVHEALRGRGWLADQL